MVINLIKRGLSILVLIFLLFSTVAASETSRGLIYPEYSKVISMDFQNANLKDVLKIFSKQSGLNFVAAEGVQERRVTVYLDSVPVELALEKLLTANNLNYEIEPENNVFIVRESGEPELKTVTKVFFLKYASVSSSKLNNAIGSSGDSQASSSGTSSGSSSTSDSSSSAGGDSGGMADIIKGILTSKGMIKEDRRTNSLTITDVPSQFPIIEQTITQLDIATPQVMIEVEMLDVTKNTVDKMGIKIGQTLASWAGGTHTDYFPFLASRAISTGAPRPTYTAGTLSLAGMTAALEFLTTQSDTKYLARPRLLTLSNESAEIKITTQEAVGMQTTTQSAQSTTTQTQQAERVETGVSLRVTPQVNADTGEITMYIEPKVSQSKTGGTFGTNTFKDPEERYTKSMLRIKDGETIVVGGLLRTDYSKTITKVPILGDLPFIGAAFRHKDLSKNEERELIVFITPRIIKESMTGRLALQTDTALKREQDTPGKKNREMEKALEAIERKRR
ncbi:MAG: secretin N-terminal domain-containing protein [Candidatus Omnitrophota bacterium]|nr:secretin N-terminal domain-containing protein [Candidatus Omnitrophota bacterium]